MVPLISVRVPPISTRVSDLCQAILLSHQWPLKWYFTVQRWKTDHIWTHGHSMYDPGLVTHLDAHELGCFHQENSFGNIICEILLILFKPKCDISNWLRKILLISSAKYCSFCLSLNVISQIDWRAMGCVLFHRKSHRELTMTALGHYLPPGNSMSSVGLN